MNSQLRTALRLEIITIIWMIIEAAAALGAGIAARSLLLVAFGIDSGIELSSAVVVFRRFQVELTEKCQTVQYSPTDIEHKTARTAGCLLLLLSVYVLAQAVFCLATRHAAETSPLGIAVAMIAALGMPVLAKAKLNLADSIDSRALRTDAMETLTCGYLSWILLCGLLLNAVAHWWWIDSVASFAILPLLIREGVEALSSEQCQ